jgi:alginate production protein
MNARATTRLAALLLAPLLLSCVAYRRDASDAEKLMAATRFDVGPDDVLLGPRFMDKKQTWRLMGVFVDGAFVVARAELRDDDDETEIKGTLDAFDVASGRGAIGGVPFAIPKDAVVVDSEGAPLDPSKIAPGAFVKAEFDRTDAGLALRKMEPRDRGDGGAEQLQGVVESVRHARREATIGGVPARFSADAAYVFSKKDEAPPSPAARLYDPQDARRPRRFTQGDEDWRPESGFVVGDVLTLGGAVEYELEWRENHDLREDLRRDRLLHEAVLKLEASFDLGRHAYAYGSIRTVYDAVHFDQDSDVEGGEDVSLEALFVRVLDAPVEGFSLQFGRQRFEEGREWVLRSDYDAVRASFKTSFAEFETSIGEKLSDTDPEDDGVVNTLLTARFEPLQKQSLLLYHLHRRSEDGLAFDRKHMGLSGEGEIGDFQWWADFGVVKGTEFLFPVEGFGLDVACMYVFKDLPWRPSLYVGFAHGEGDGDFSDGVDGSFRQSGLHRNNDRFDGVASFRYYGTVVRPELSNMKIWTAGVGVRPSERTSVDLLFHAYRQDVPFPLLRSSRLRYDPNGLDDDLGVGVDLIIGLEDARPWEFEIDVGWFDPGAAFTAASAAWYVLFQAKYSF